MRVTALPPLYPPRSRVGAWLATHQLLAGLAARGHQVTVVPFLARAGHGFDLDGVRVEPRLSLAQAIVGADVVIAHAGRSQVDALQSLHVHAPVVRLVHGLPCNPQRLAGAALVVANSEATAAVFTDRRLPILVVRPPVRTADFATTPGDRVTLVNLAAEKGGAVFWALAERCPDLDFLGVYGGHGAQLTEDLPNVEVVGPNVQAMRDDVYARTRLLLMPSKHETWGMVGVEAMASGIPVLARPTPGLRESLGDAGLWCDTEDPRVWADVVRHVLADDAGFAIASQQARRRAADLDALAVTDLDAFAVTVEGLAR